MSVVDLECIRCGARQPVAAVVDGCTACAVKRSNLRIRYKADAASRFEHARASSSRLLWRYAPMLPVSTADIVSLQEGGTPLVHATRLGRRFGLEKLYLKDETRNPTGSYKDRLSTVAVSAGRQMNASVLATASSGNAGASLAAYAARAGMPCVVFTYAGTAGPMLTQIKKYGAKVVPLARKEDRWPLLARCVQTFNWFATSPYSAPVVGSHPLGIEGYKTIAYEICADMNWSCPDWVVMPVCYGDALAGAWYGFLDMHAAGMIDRLPKMVAVEVFGSLTKAMAKGLDEVPDMPAPFAALAVSVAASQSSFQALNAIRQSDGCALQVGNDDLIAMQETLAETEGILAELTAAMPMIAIEKLARSRQIGPADKVVSVVTASGLKDLDRSTAETKDEPVAVHGSFDEVLHYLADRLNFDPTQAAPNQTGH